MAPKGLGASAAHGPFGRRVPRSGSRTSASRPLPYEEESRDGALVPGRVVRWPACSSASAAAAPVRRFVARVVLAASSAGTRRAASGAHARRRSADRRPINEVAAELDRRTPGVGTCRAESASQRWPAEQLAPERRRSRVRKPTGRSHRPGRAVAIGDRVASRSRRAASVEHEGDPVPRSMWKGAIQFGLVTIPVKLYVATESRPASASTCSTRRTCRGSR